MSRTSRTLPFLVAVTLLGSFTPLVGVAQAAETATPPLIETWDVDSIANGEWSACPTVCTVADGTLHMQGGVTEGIWRPLSLSPDAVVAQVIVKPVQQGHFFISLSGPTQYGSGAVAVELVPWCFCLTFHEFTGFWQVLSAGWPPYFADRTLDIRLSLVGDFAQMQIFDADTGEFIGSRTGTTALHASDIDAVSVVIVSNEGYSDYLVREVRVVPAGPYGFLRVADDASAVAAPDVALGLHFETGLDTLSQMRFSDDNATWSDWEAFAPTKAWTLPGEDGAKRVYAEVRNSAGRIGHSYDDIVLDRSAPVFPELPTVTVEATGPEGAAVDYGAVVAQDAISGAIETTCAPASGSLFALGASSVSCSASDAVGNTALAAFTIDVVDITAPTIDAMADLVAEATGPDGAIVSFDAPAASDVVDGPLGSVCAPASGSTFALGTHAVDCVATDAAGNAATSSFVVLVQDTVAPVLTLPASVVANATSEDGAAVDFAASALDLVDGAVAPTCSPASGSVFAIGNTTVACSAVDAAGNLASGAFQVRVRRTIQLDLAMENETYAQTDALLRGLRGSALVSFPGGEPVVNATVRVTIARASPELPVLNEETFEGRTNATGVFAFSPSVVLSLLGEYALVASAIDMHGATADAEGAYAVTPAGSTRK